MHYTNTQILHGEGVGVGGWREEGGKAAELLSGSGSGGEGDVGLPSSFKRRTRDCSCCCTGANWASCVWVLPGRRNLRPSCAFGTR